MWVLKNDLECNRSVDILVLQIVLEITSYLGTNSQTVLL